MPGFRHKKVLSQNDFTESQETAPLFWSSGNESVEKKIKPCKKQRTYSEGHFCLSKKCAVFPVNALCRLGYNQVCSQPTFLYFMMQF